MDWTDYFSAVEKWEQGEQLDERQARMIAYGWTAGTCGQRVRPNDVVKVKVANGICEERKKASDARNLFLRRDGQSKYPAASSRALGSGKKRRALSRHLS